MPVPKSVIKFKKGNVEYVSSVDRTKYLLEELQRAALRDSAKIIQRRVVDKIRKLPGLRKKKGLYRTIQYWVRKRETDLQIGFGNTKKGLTGDRWFAIRQELGSAGKVGKAGTAKMKGLHILKETVMENINEIRRVQGKYLSEIEDENRALGIIDAEGNPYYPEDKDE